MTGLTDLFEQTEGALEAALRADGVLTENQIRRYFPHQVQYVGRYPRRIVHVSSTKHRGEVQTRFYALDSRLLRREATALRHLVLAAELRLSQGIPPEEWRNEADVASLEKPDALWLPSSNQGGKGIPVEIDVGTYSQERIRHKLLHYDRAYGSQLWGSPSARRAGMIQEIAAELGIQDYKLYLLTFP